MKASEKLFIAVCVIAIAVSAAAVYLSSDRRHEGVRIIEEGSGAQEEYDVSAINSATAEDFMEVDGIGEVRAGDIIAYREAVGGFRSVYQLKDVNGISDAIFERIIAHFYPSAMPEKAAPAEETAPEAAAEPSPKTEPPKTEPPRTAAQKTEPAETMPAPATEPPETAPLETERTMRSVNINSATADELADALIIDPELAGEIVALRERIHSFSQVQELYLCDSMDAKTYRRIKDYILFE